jgi:RND family efflux transporter MFP subunit
MALSRTTLSVLSVIVILGALGAGIAYRLQSEDQGSDDSTSETTPAEDLPEVSASQQFSTDVPQPVTGVPARRDTLWITVTAAGQAEAFREAGMNALVAGQVMSVPVAESDFVRAGEELVRIDSTEYAMAVARARSDLLSSEAEYRRMLLFDEEVASDSVRAERERFARVRSRLAQNQLAVEEAEMNLARSRVRAPFPGVIADVDVVEGHYVGAGDPLMTVIELDPIKVEVQVLEAEVGYLEPGRRAAVTFAAFPGEVFRGSVESINPRVDPETRTARVTILLSNPAGRIKPGMYARVSLETRSIADQVLVPRTAVLERDRRTMLFVFEGDGDTGRAKWRYVTTGPENDSLVAIIPNEETSMVEPGEIVLVDGHHYLVHDATVRLAENVPAEDGRPGR